MPLNGWQLVLKTRVQVTVGVRFLRLPLSTRSRKVRRCADNTETGGAVPSWWIDELIIPYSWVVGIAAVQRAFNPQQRGSTPLPPIFNQPLERIYVLLYFL